MATRTLIQRVEDAARTVHDLLARLDLSTTTRDSIRESLIIHERNLTDIANHLRRTSFDPGALGSHARKVHDSALAAARRPENIPLEDPEVVEARWGVVDRGEDGEVPAWFKERFAPHLKETDAEADPSTGPVPQ